MPRIRCPNCGTSISLESRRETDIEIILGSLTNGRKTFTELLHVTRLPRKTLSLRLKELADSGKIVKGNGYSLDTSSLSSSERQKYSKWKFYRVKSKVSRFIKDDPSGNRDALLIGTVFILIMALYLYNTPLIATAHKVHNFSLQSQISGSFTIDVSVSDAADLYAWQGKITYDPRKLVVLDVQAGDFLSLNTLVINATDNSYHAGSARTDSILVFADESAGTLWLGGSLLGDASGKDGSGVLATVTFGVLVDADQGVDVSLEGGMILLNADLSDTEGLLSAEI